MFLLATGLGALTVSAVLAALYPTVTVVLATALLRERTKRIQIAGLMAASIAVTAMVLG